MTRSLIEQWLPAASIGAESVRETGTFTALPPTFALHVWWARRPHIASRAAVIASALPAWPTLDEAEGSEDCKRVLAGLQNEFPGGEAEYHAWFLLCLGIAGDPVASRKAIAAAKEAGIKLPGNGYGYPRAFTESPGKEVLERISRLAALRNNSESGEMTLLDMFSGGGSIPFEAVRYGFNTYANELNPVASAILEGTVALPSDLGVEFTRIISVWGNRWASRVRKRLDEFYPLQGGETVVAYVWAHTVPCPTTGRPTPLSPNYWLARPASGLKVAVDLEIDHEEGVVHPRIVEGSSAMGPGSRATYKNGTATSIWTGETFSGEYIQEMAQSGHLGQQLLALAITRSGVKGRKFRAPTGDDLAAVQAAEKELSVRLPGWEISDLAPTDEIPDGWKTSEPRRMGLTRWSDMFTPRQLLANLTALEETQKIVSEAREEISEPQANALGLYLAFAVSKCLNYNSRMSVWHSLRQVTANTFSQHDLSFKMSFAELDAAHSLPDWAIDQMRRTYEGTARLISGGERLDSSKRSGKVAIISGSAAQLPLESQSVDFIVTDPPYSDNVMYAELSDYFYVWLKRALKSTWPQFTQLVATDKASEAVANPHLFKDVAPPVQRGRKKADVKTAAKLADDRYEELMKHSFREAHRVLKSDGVMTVMFTHKKISAWDTLGSALLDSGFSINSSWPVHTESENSLHQAKKNSAKSSIFLGCRKRVNGDPAYWSDIRRDVERAAEDAVTRFAEQGMTGVDLTIATYGPVLSVLSDRWPVYTGELDGDGKPEILRPDAALDLAREKVASLKKRELLGGRDIDFDRITDWYLLAWSDFAAAEFPYDEARKLSIATHLEIDDLAKRHKVIKASSGSVTLLTPAQRVTAGALDPDAAEFVTWLDRLHALMALYDSDGLGAAKAWLGRTRLADDSTLTEVVRAALYAIPRVKDKGAFARPEARVLDSLRAALFDHIEPPADEVEPVVVQHEQQTFGFDV
ncbi:DUF1156 domain-containing protein [Streptomyces flaveolus]|uniref:DUF1156 domain-containing protein n=1 Tax=Streptomyces flaveolus TaxID=67297 RepID=A0ABV1V7Z4_9ACTN